MVKHKLLALLLACTAWVVSTPALAIDDLFNRNRNSLNGGFEPPKDTLYLKECSGCHFVYAPGMLPARSWAALMKGTRQHFGESLGLEEASATAISQYLQQNAADRVQQGGSQVLMESLPTNLTPQRVMSVPRLRVAHRVMLEVIGTQPAVKVRTLINCDGCHQRAIDGDYSWEELRIDGLTKIMSVVVPGYWNR